MEKRNLYILAFCFFSLGLSIELLKNLAPPAPKIKVIDSAQQLADYDVNLGVENIAAAGFKVPPLSPHSVKPIQGIPIARQKTTLAKNTNKATASDSKKEKKKKKKKKKKEIAEKTINTRQNLPHFNGTSESLPTHSVFPNGATITTVVPPSISEKPSPPDWEKILLDNPSFEDLRKFIDAHRSKEVSDAQYLQLARMMIEDPRQKIRASGLALLNAWPSTTTFTLLAESYFHEPSNSEFRGELEQGVLSYTQLNYWPFLSEALDINNSDAVITVALDMVEKAIQLSIWPPTGQPSVAQPTSGLPMVPPTPGLPTAQPTSGLPMVPPTPGLPTAQPTSGLPVVPPTPGLPTAQPTSGLPATQPATSLAAPGPIVIRQIVQGLKYFEDPLKRLTIQKDAEITKHASQLLAIIKTLTTSLTAPTLTASAPDNVNSFSPR